MTRPKSPRSLYSKKPLQSKELAKRAGFLRHDSFKQYRQKPELRPEHAKRKRVDRW